ncbi:hypothetical protein ACLOJK_000116 [Asimina triloba]
MDQPEVEEKDLPPPPPIIPPSAKKVAMNRVPIARSGTGRKGQSIKLCTNHFKVGVTNTDGFFSHYSQVSLCYEDGSPVEGKGIGRKVMDRVHRTYTGDFHGKYFAYDGEKSLFTVGALPQQNFEFNVVLEDLSSNKVSGNSSPHGNDSPGEGDRKRQRRPYQSKTFKVEIRFAARIPMKAIANALRGQDSESSQEALRVLDIILRQHAAKQYVNLAVDGLAFISMSANNSNGCRGCLLVRQSFFHNEPRNFVDIGGGIAGCRGFHSSFRTSQGGLSLNIDVSTTMTIKPGPVVDFLIANQNVRNPGEIDWGKAKRTLKNLRVKTRPLNMEFKIVGLSELPCNQQTFSLKQKNERNGDSPSQTVEITVYDYFVNYRHIELGFSESLPCINVGKPKRPTYYPIEALRSSNYEADEMLKACGISINNNFTQVEGRVLSAPKLMVGNDEYIFPRNGRWSFSNKKLVKPQKIERWAVVNFSARCDVRSLAHDLHRCGGLKGVVIAEPFDYFEESPQFRNAPPTVRVDKMFETIQSKLPSTPQFLLCVLPDRKNCNIYGWLRCFSFVVKATMLILSPNGLLGGLNSLLAVEHSPSLPIVSKAPTIILGMDVSHGSPGQSDVPSIAAVVSSMQWPKISYYRASVRTQSPKVEMIDSLFKPVSDKEDRGIIQELLVEFYKSSEKRKPDQIIIFRDGVSESQFTQVLNVELDQIIQGTSRPTHYHVLWDEIGFSPDDLQELVHSLSYVELFFRLFRYQRSMTAISIVAPISYAHLAATQLSHFVKFDDSSETSSSQGGFTSAGPVPVPELPMLHKDVCFINLFSHSIARAVGWIIARFAFFEPVTQ